jgi:hypothetical protein
MENRAVTVTVVEEDEHYFLVVGEGKHSCYRWEISLSLLDKLAFEVITLSLSRRSKLH